MSAAMLMQKNVVKDRILCSPMEGGAWRPEEVKGSFYMTMYRKVRQLHNAHWYKILNKLLSRAFKSFSRCYAHNKTNERKK